jgi:hypothetical protein
MLDPPLSYGADCAVKSKPSEIASFGVGLAIESGDLLC